MAKMESVLKNKSYWIWKWGEYEIYHGMLVHSRREERGFIRPAVWKVATPYPSVQFIKTVQCEKDGYLFVTLNGKGSVVIDGKYYPTQTRLDIPKGEHRIRIEVWNHQGLPCAYVESDVCPSDGSWLCNHFAGEFTPVGYNEHFTSVSQNPEIFPFEYETVLPIKIEEKAGGIVYDFGKELFGLLSVENADENRQMEVYYGESEEEALDVDFTYVTERISGRKSYLLKQHAFRYIYVKNAQKDLYVSAKFERLPLRKQGEFRCDDTLFNDIYDVASYTFFLNCREGFLDGIKRDRWIWSGDAYQSARINQYLYFDKDIEQRTLVALIGKEPIEQHINTILDYSLIWIINLYEHYLAYADKAFLQRVYKRAKKLVEFCETRLNDDGFLQGKEDDWTFIDWSDIDKDGAVCAEQMLLVKAYSSMAFLGKEIGDTDNEIYYDKATNLLARVNEFYWDEQKGAYIDSYTSGKRSVTRHANIFAVTYDLATDEQKQSILKKVLKNDEITKITTPYFEGYELDALAKLGEFATIENLLSSYWGGMISLGATTIWEEYDPNMKGIEHYAMYGGKYEKSLCHAWGAGPIYLFGRYYLGVRPTSAGYETFTVKPNLGNLKRISGVAPVNGGVVSVTLDCHELKVVATKQGGSVDWKGKIYPLEKDKELVIKF